MTEVPAGGSVPSVPLRRGDSGAWPVGRALLATLIVFGGGQLVGLALLQAIVGSIAGWDAVLDPTAMSKLEAGTQQWLLVGVQLGITTLQIGLVWAVAGWGGDRAAALGLGLPQYGPFEWVKAVALVFAVKIAASVAILPLAESGSTARDLKPFIELAKDTRLWAAFLVAAVVGAAIEELVFRSLLSRSLEATRLGFWGGALVASAIFAVLHVQYGFAGQLVVLALGVVFSYLRATSGSIVPGIVAHALNNAVALLAMKVVA